MGNPLNVSWVCAVHHGVLWTTSPPKPISQSWFQLLFESCAIEVIQMALLRASERSGRILGNMVEVYHIVYTHFVFGNSLVQDLDTSPNDWPGQNLFFLMTNNLDNPAGYKTNCTECNSRMTLQTSCEPTNPVIPIPYQSKHATSVAACVSCCIARLKRY